MDDDEKRDEEQEVEDTDADTRDVTEKEDTIERDQASDNSEVIRKLDAITESMSAMMQAITQIAKDSGTAPAVSSPSEDAGNDDGFVDLEDLDFTI